MADPIVLDTGFLVALVNAADPDHERCSTYWKDLKARIVTVEGVLVEAAHLLGRTRGGPGAALNLVADAGATIIPMDGGRMRAAAKLMAQYQNVPMDLVDALVVLAAHDQGARDVLTLDRRGFTVYRTPGRRALGIQPPPE